MNVKHLLMALAVPMAFAACSQDEFVNEVQKVNDGRPVVGAISLDLQSAPQTRWGWGSTGFTFDGTDFIGASLMDEIADLAKTEWTEKYTIVNTISTNYKYGYKDGWTNNDAVMSEGNYFFYMPYNADLKSRAGLSYSIPTDQTAYDETAATADETRAWKESQMFIGYAAVKVDDQEAAPNLVELHAKPRFTVKYADSDGVLVERIVMRDETGKFAVTGSLKPAETLDNEYDPISGGANPSTYQTAASPNLAVAFAAYNKALDEYELQDGESFANPLAGNEAKFIEAGTEVSDLSLNFIPAKEVSALMVVPAGTHTQTNLKFDIYTNKGMVSFTSNAAGKLETAEAGKSLTYSNVDKLAEIKAGQGAKADAVTINFGDKDITQPDEVTVSTTSQLESIIRWYAAIEKDLTVTLSGDNVELSEKVYNAIKGNSKLTVKFTGGALTIPATAKEDALALVATTSDNIIKIAGKQSLTYTTATTLAYEIEVGANAALTISAGTGAKATTVQDITNKGTLTIAAGDVKTASGKTITNTNALTIAANATLTAKVLNNADSNNGMYTQNAVITNNGMLNMQADSENQCTINNNNKLDVQGETTNKKVAAVQNGTNGYTAVINNLDATKSYIYANAQLTNEGTIDNKGAMYSQGSGSIQNDGYIKANDGSTTYITTNNGDIELESRGTETQVNTENGVKSYTMKSTDLTSGAFKFDSSSDKFNSLKIGMNVKFAKAEDAPNNIVLTGANLTVTCGEATSFASITAAAGYRYMLQGTEVQTAKLTVEAGAVFQIPALSTFAVYTKETVSSVDDANALVDNAGEILVGGTFYANFSDNTPVGTLSSAGNGSYNWDDDTKNFGVQQQP